MSVPAKEIPLDPDAIGSAAAALERALSQVTTDAQAEQIIRELRRLADSRTVAQETGDGLPAPAADAHGVADAIARASQAAPAGEHAAAIIAATARRLAAVPPKEADALDEAILRRDQPQHSGHPARRTPHLAPASAAGGHQGTRPAVRRGHGGVPGHQPTPSPALDERRHAFRHDRDEGGQRVDARAVRRGGARARARRARPGGNAAAALAGDLRHRGAGKTVLPPPPSFHRSGASDGDRAASEQLFVSLRPQCGGVRWGGVAAAAVPALGLGGSMGWRWWWGSPGFISARIILPTCWSGRRAGRSSPRARGPSGASRRAGWPRCCTRCCAACGGCSVEAATRPVVLRGRDRSPSESQTVCQRRPSPWAHRSKADSKGFARRTIPTFGHDAAARREAQWPAEAMASLNPLNTCSYFS